eukprot:356745_1
MTTNVSKSSFYLNQINQKTKMIVFGYIREIQSQLSHLNIPMEVHYLCLAYKSHGEYFDPIFLGDGTELSKDQLTITNTSERCWECGDEQFEDCYECYVADKSDPVGYGHQAIESYKDRIAIWKVRINNETSLKRRYWENGVHFIVQMMDENIFDEDNESYWTYICSFWNTSSCSARLDSSVTIAGNSNDKSTVGDVVTIVLDTKRSQIFSQTNDKEMKHLFSKLPVGDNITYKLCITV